MYLTSPIVGYLGGYCLLPVVSGMTIVIKIGQQAPNGVTYAKHHIMKPRFNLTVLTPPETES